jgi:hypothetical protein
VVKGMDVVKAIYACHESGQFFAPAVPINGITRD